MTEDAATPAEGELEFAEAMGLANGADRQRKFSEAADKLRVRMEAHAAKVREIVSGQPPLALLGFLWSGIFVELLGKARDEKAEAVGQFEDFQFALEYVHAVWSSTNEKSAAVELQETAPSALYAELAELKRITMHYCMASSMASTSLEFGDHTQDIEFKAKTTWVLVRGHRYQVLESEFFNFVLAPHDEALREAYGIGAAEIASGIQAIADSMRIGLPNAVLKLQEWMDKTHDLAEREGLSLDEAIASIKKSDDSFTPEMATALHDVFYGGICNLSRHTKLPVALLDDLAFNRGDESEFFKPGEFSGTPLRTLPARVRPLIKVDDDFYAPDAVFVRDSAYRAIQRGLLGRLPTYRNDWKENQTRRIERAFEIIFANQLARGKCVREVFYKNPDNGDWAEADWICAVEDILLVVEAKSGISTLSSPATNFERHARAVRELIVKAYQQCDRFIRYLSTSEVVPIYNRAGDKYVEVGRLKLSDFRMVFPIGLTVESFTPFSAMSKEIPGVKPIVAKHPFMSMSVDDLFVLNRFLPTAGALFHYLEVRQQVAGIPQAMLFDELDHLGAYISKNRFDDVIRDQLKEADRVTWDTFSEVLDEHFAKPDWELQAPPVQEFPPTMLKVLASINKSHGAKRLLFDALLRTMGGVGRSNFARCIETLIPSLSQFPVRRFLMGEDAPIQVWLCRVGATPSKDEVKRQGEIACLATRSVSVPVLTCWFDQSGEPTTSAFQVVSAPSVLQGNYSELRDEAKKQRAKMGPVSQFSA